MKNNNKKCALFLNIRAKKFLGFIKFIKYKVINKTPLCRIEEINLTKKTIVIHCRGIDAPIKLTLDEIINDSIILSNLSSKQASWIGYYYGKHYRELIDENINYNNIFNFNINESSGKCNILMLNRHGSLTYFSQDDNTTHTISPINAMINENIIMQFTHIQACYIGILAGTSNLKKFNKKSQTKKIQLNIVK